MKKIPLKEILFVFLFVFSFATQVFANSLDVDKTREIQKAKSIDKSKTKTESSEKSKVQGTGESERKETGRRNSEVRSISNALEKLKSNGIVIEVSIPQLVVKEISKLHPEVFDFTVNDFYTVPLAENGIVYTTRIRYLNSIAQAQQGTEYLKSNLVVSFIKRYMSIAYQIKDSIKLLDNETFGMDEYEEIVKDIVKNVDVNKNIDIFPVSDDCILYGDYQKFKCGTCVLDISNTSGIPTLLCSGVPILSQGFVMGYSIKASANTTYSFRNVESEISSTQIYKNISNAVEKYKRQMEKEGITINKTLMKKLLLQTALKDSNKFKLAIGKMNDNEKPAGIFKIIK